MITVADLPRTTEGAVIMDTDNYAGWSVTRTPEGFYAQCEAYDIKTVTPEEMVAKLNQIGAVVVGWE